MEHINSILVSKKTVLLTLRHFLEGKGLPHLKLLHIPPDSHLAFESHSETFNTKQICTVHMGTGEKNLLYFCESPGQGIKLHGWETA